MNLAPECSEIQDLWLTIHHFPVPKYLIEKTFSLSSWRLGSRKRELDSLT